MGGISSIPENSINFVCLKISAMEIEIINPVVFFVLTLGQVYGRRLIDFNQLEKVCPIFLARLCIYLKFTFEDIQILEKTHRTFVDDVLFIFCLEHPFR